VKVDVALDYGGKGDSVALCTKLFHDFHYKKKRVLLGQTINAAKFEINRTHADQVLIAFRKLSIGMHLDFYQVLLMYSLKLYFDTR
jgi:hypothetical protein